MPRHELETVEGKRAKYWGLGVFLGSTALSAVFYVGAASTPPDGTVVCSNPTAATEVCAPIHGEQAFWFGRLEYSGAAAVLGGISFFGSGALDRKLAVRRYADRVDSESRASWTPDLGRYMNEMPTAPPDVDYTNSD